MSVDDREEARAVLLDRLQTKSHWTVALTEAVWPLTDVFLAAIEAQHADGSPPAACWRSCA